MRKKIKEAYPAFDSRHQSIVLFNTNASDLVPLRRWPREYYINLARMIMENYEHIVILLTGENSERADKEVIVEAVNSGRCVNFAGRTSLSELPALYSMSEFMVTNDSGPAHFASVTDMPVYALFGPETPKVYGPLGAMTPIYAGLACSPCVSATNHRKSICNDNVCLQAITAKQVFEVIRTRLELFRSKGESHAINV